MLIHKVKCDSRKIISKKHDELIDLYQIYNAPVILTNIKNDLIVINKFHMKMYYSIRILNLWDFDGNKPLLKIPV
jgi:hypothetical protein